MRTATLVMLGGLAGCGTDLAAYQDFALLDVNPTSPSAGLEVGPEDHLDHISAWYFGHAN